MLLTMSWWMELVVIIGANVLGAAMALPQAARLVRTRRTDGVSAGWAAMSISTNAWWIAYGVAVGSWAIVPVSVVGVIGYGVVLAALVRFRGSGWALFGPTTSVVVAGVALAPVSGLVGGGWPLVGLVLGGLYGIQLAPAVLGTYRATNLAGVSAGTWVLAWVEAVLWGVYGLEQHDPGLIVLAAAGLAASSAVLLRLVISARTAPGAATAAAGLGGSGPAWSGVPGPAEVPAAAGS